jgi:hypothetical protein
MKIKSNKHNKIKFNIELSYAEMQELHNELMNIDHQGLTLLAVKYPVFHNLFSLSSEVLVT